MITLDRLKELTGVTNEQLDKECEEIHLEQLAQSIVEYRKYGSRLGLTRADIREIEQQPALVFSMKDKTAAVFKEWHRRSPSHATYRALVEVALKLEDGSSAIKICKLCVEVHS